MLEHLLLPAVTLGLLICGVFIRLVRVNILQTMQADYVEAAEARGISPRKVTRKHAFRNALVPVITVIGLQFALLLGGAVLTESTFNWPGLGQKLVEYINNRDYGAVQGIVTIFAVAVVLISLLVDIVNALDRPAGEVLMRGVLRTLAKPFTETAGLARWMLVIGVAAHRRLRGLRDLRALAGAVRLRPVLRRRRALPQARRPRARSTGSAPTGCSSTSSRA